MANLSDTELIRLIPEQKSAFDVLFLRYKEDVHKVVVHYIQDRVLAEDMVQEAFLKIYLSLKKGAYNEEGKFLPWALRIAHNLCMDHLRKAKQRVLSLSYDSDFFKHPQTDGTAEAELVKKQQQQQLNDLVSKLPVLQRETVGYRYFDECSFKEIAAMMDTSVNTSLGRMRYALLHLRKQMERNRSFVWR